MRRFFLSFRYAFEGLMTAFKRERNLKVHMIAAFLVVVFGFVFQLTISEWMILILTIAVVIIAELINTAIERTVDLVSPKYHPLAKEAKDIAAAACLISAVTSVIIGILLFGSKLYIFFID